MSKLADAIRRYNAGRDLYGCKVGGAKLAPQATVCSGAQSKRAVPATPATAVVKRGGKLVRIAVRALTATEFLAAATGKAGNWPKLEATARYARVVRNYR